jgi:hypothetical protein
LNDFRSDSGYSLDLHATHVNSLYSIFTVSALLNPPASYRRDKFTIHSKSVVCQDVELKGDITIGAGLHQSPDSFHPILDFVFQCRDCGSPKGDHICYSGSYRHRFWLHHRGRGHHRQQVRFRLFAIEQKKQKTKLIL